MAYARHSPGPPGPERLEASIHLTICSLPPPTRLPKHPQIRSKHLRERDPRGRRGARSPPETRSEESSGLRDFAGIRFSRLRRGIGEFRTERGCDPAIGRWNGGAGGCGAGDTGGGGGVAAACQGAAEDQAEAPPGAGRRCRRDADGRGDRGQAPRGASPEAGGSLFSLPPDVTSKLLPLLHRTVLSLFVDCRWID
jgi:hypothetical protein